MTETFGQRLRSRRLAMIDPETGRATSQEKLARTLLCSLAVIRKYDNWLEDQLSAHNPEILDAMTTIAQLHAKGKTVVLLCFCYPRDCHGTIIRNKILARLDFFTTAH